MVTHQIWKTFPPTYHADEMQTLARWIRAGESSSTAGLAVWGCSTRPGFLRALPDELRSYLPSSAEPVAPISLDADDLRPKDAPIVYRVQMICEQICYLGLSCLTDRMALQPNLHNRWFGLWSSYHRRRAIA